MVRSTLTDVERYRYITINQVYQQVATAAEQWYIYIYISFSHLSFSAPSMGHVIY